MTELGTVPNDLRLIFPSQADLKDQLLATAAEPLVEALARGYMTEVELFNRVKRTQKATTAQEVLDLLGLDSLGEMFDFELPEAMLQQAVLTVAESFSQDYWSHINTTTSQDMQRVLNQAVSDGWSIRRAATEFSRRFGQDYSLKRATLVARTEIPDMLNKGHDMAIRDTAREVPELNIGKEWLSVFARLSRASHMSMDGTTVPAEGFFELNGIRCTHPASSTLPAKDRCNCMCTILSSFITEELGVTVQEQEQTPEPEPAPEPTPDPSVITPEVPQAPVERPKPPEPKTLVDRINQNERLEELRQKILDEAIDEVDPTEHDRLHKAALDARAAYNSHKRNFQRFVNENRLEEYQKISRELAEEANVKIDAANGWHSKVASKKYEKTAQQVSDILAIDKADRVDVVPITDLQSSRSGEPYKTNKKVSAAVASKAKKAAAFLSKLFSKKVRGKNDMRVPMFQLKKGERAFQLGEPDDWDDWDNLDPDDYRKVGVFVDSGDTIVTHVHEMTHAIEMRSGDLHKKTNEFLKIRIERAKTQTRPMNSILNVSRYDFDEVGNEDDFSKAFKGNKSLDKAAYTGKTYKGSNATELLTMGVQNLIENPKHFAENDPEFFKFIVGVLRGEL